METDRLEALGGCFAALQPRIANYANLQVEKLLGTNEPRLIFLISNVVSRLFALRITFNFRRLFVKEVLVFFSFRE